MFSSKSLSNIENFLASLYVFLISTGQTKLMFLYEKKVTPLIVYLLFATFFCIFQFG